MTKKKQQEEIVVEKVAVAPKPKTIKPVKKIIHSKKDKVSFGFYNYLILFVVVAISLSRILYFLQDVIIYNFPVSEFYLNYFFENIRNIFEIWKNLITY